jgi:hypothetical protein
VRRPFVLGVDQQADAANFLGHADATVSGPQEQHATEAASLNFLIDRETAETENRHVVAGKPLFDQRGCATVFERPGAQRVETKNPRGPVGRRGDGAFRAATFMILAGIALQVNVEVGIAAIEGSAIMMLGEWRFLSCVRFVVEEGGK